EAPVLETEQDLRAEHEDARFVERVFHLRLELGHLCKTAHSARLVEGRRALLLSPLARLPPAHRGPGGLAQRLEHAAGGGRLAAVSLDRIAAVAGHARALPGDADPAAR